MAATPFEKIESFLPSIGRGAALDARMHIDLADSLDHISAQTAVPLPDVSARLKTIEAALRAGRRVPPMAFRKYYSLVQALLAENATDVEAALTAIETLGARAGARTFMRFGEPKADQISLELLTDGFRMAPIDADEAAEFTALCHEGLDLMQRALPALFSDVDAMVREVLLARAPAGDAMEFDGASHFQFWGLLLLNPKHHKTPLAVVEVLAHEASHSLLFGLTRHEPLVHNPDDELYASPLRKDPRPMDGIYHAAFVSARMWWAMDQMSRSEFLSPTERAEARDAAETDRANWEMGLSVIDAHARMSETGARILEDARHVMSAQT
ncbi:MAG: HEXXH motif-containing putative peptide modification protein [Pseudomonadota bacterium]